MPEAVKSLLNKKELVFIGGPCVIESEDLVFEIATHLRDVTKELGLPFIFKASFDKANRTSMDSFRGPGLDKGLEILSNVKSKLGLELVTDFHLPQQAAEVASVVDLPLRFCVYLFKFLLISKESFPACSFILHLAYSLF